MSQENVERIREVVAAMNRGDFETALERSHPDVEWQALDVFPDAETYHGREGLRAFFQTWLDTFRGFRVHLEKCEALDEHRVVAMVRVSGEGTGGGVEVASPPFFQLFELRDGLLIRARMFQTESEALEAAGLRE
jgi:ketosteroid isomerase-like protein